ncbi:T3SS (YopN, CesT) and YbjN peptide-binding chaperone 1 [Luteococcus sp. Sow4_B9]|uniref:T3SS (YopN, CesT) and YbjN peptide-binding chaperone 1 n=1 Tax=Luteococcus sp. Sow4_B9 TaxID=3438792 RepID=UPI003F9BFB1C
MTEELVPEDAFDFDASTNQAWALFGERLAEVVSVIEDGGTLVVGTGAADEGAPYVRFTCGVRPSREELPTVVAEASTNASLGERYHLTPSQLAELLDLGWREPAPGGPGSPNLWAEHVQDETSDLADLALATLRDVFGVPHPVFLAPDQLAEILAPAPSVVEGSAERLVAPAPRDAVAVTWPSNREELVELVRAQLAAMFGHEPLRDDEGDFAIRVGSGMVFVRCTADAREVLLFSVLVHDLEGRGRAVEVLNDLNCESRFGRFALYKDRVFVSMSLLARPFVAQHLEEGVTIVSQITDGIDDDLAAKLRGRVTFTEDE